jgi:hypothetical protein
MDQAAEVDQRLAMRGFASNAVDTGFDADIPGHYGLGGGGIAAVTDSTIEVNFHFHNRLWAPAHFHT